MSPFVRNEPEDLPEFEDYELAELAPLLVEALTFPFPADFPAKPALEQPEKPGNDRCPHYQ